MKQWLVLSCSALIGSNRGSGSLYLLKQHQFNACIIIRLDGFNINTPPPHSFYRLHKSIAATNNFNPRLFHSVVHLEETCGCPIQKQVVSDKQKLFLSTPAFISVGDLLNVSTCTQFDILWYSCIPPWNQRIVGISHNKYLNM